MTEPNELLYCKVTGVFKAFVADGADGDDLPDFTPMIGSGVIKAHADRVYNTTPGATRIYFPNAINIDIDENGQLSQGGRPYVMLLCPSAHSNPPEWTYEITLTLQVGTSGAKVKYGPFTFPVTPGGEVDLANVLPVGINKGEVITRGERGERGETGPQGPIGPQGPTGADSTVPGPAGPQGPIGPMPANAIVTVTHGADATVARPAGIAAVYWIGSVTPTNAATYDLFFDTAEG